MRSTDLTPLHARILGRVIRHIGPQAIIYDRVEAPLTLPREEEAAARYQFDEAEEQALLARVRAALQEPRA